MKRLTMMKQIILALVAIALMSGCATWGGMKRDAKDSYEWTKDKINGGASYVKEKTE